VRFFHNISIALSVVSVAAVDGKESTATSASDIPAACTALAKSNGTASVTRDGAVFFATKISIIAPTISLARMVAFVLILDRDHTPAAVLPVSPAPTARFNWMAAAPTTPVKTGELAKITGKTTLANVKKASRATTVRRLQSHAKTHRVPTVGHV